MVLGATVIVCVTVTSGVAGDVDGDEAEVTPGVEVLPDGDVTPERADAPDAVPVITDGEKIVGGAVGGAVDDPEVQAETATRARRVRAPQHRAVSLALSGVPAVVPRTFMDPSSCARQMTTVFPLPAAETGISERKMRDRSGRRPRRHRQVPKAPAVIKARPVSGADAQWPVHHRDIRLTE
jgi:hypothetical protein